MRVLALAIRAADASGLPLMVGLAEPDGAPLEEQLALLRAGDVVTYAFRSTPWSLMHAGQPIEAARDARRRGVLFDGSHGLNSFDPSIARAAIASGLTPDSISSDRQASDGGPSLPLPSVLSKVVHAGLPVERALMAATRAPAAALGLPAHVGDLVAGTSRDLAVLHGPVNAWRGATLLADGALIHGPAGAHSARVASRARAPRTRQ
jgi:dihydroorotase